MTPPADKPLILDLGGEGRHVRAWNVNPSPMRTIGRDRGRPIPRLLLGRADSIPLPDACADQIIVERTPLTATAFREIRRVLAPRGTVTLRHAIPPGIDPHALARELLGEPSEACQIILAGRTLQQSCFVLG